VRPSPPLPHHAGHCGNIPALLGRTGTRHHHNCHCATYGPSSTAPSSRPTTASVNQPLHRHPRSRSYTSTGRTTAPQQERDLPRRSSAPGTVRHTSTRREIERHACKLLPPWPIKGGAAPQPRGHGATDSDRSHVLRLLHDIGTRLNQDLWDLEAMPSLSASLVATPLRAPRCKQYSAPSTPLLDVRPRTEPG
jgi:hypothetical protein